MPNLLELAKQFRGVRKMQKDLARKVAEARSPDGTVTVRVSGDLVVQAISVDARVLTPDRRTDLENTLTRTLNSALEEAKRTAAEEMSKMASELGLPGLMGLGR